jgi:hypothetical protein
MVGFWNVAVAVKTTGVRPDTVAVDVCVWAAVPRVQDVCARPVASVGPLVGLADPCDTDQTTVVLGTGFPYRSCASTTSGAGSVVPPSAV